MIKLEDVISNVLDGKQLTKAELKYVFSSDEETKIKVIEAFFRYVADEDVDIVIDISIHRLNNNTVYTVDLQTKDGKAMYYTDHGYDTNIRYCSESTFEHTLNWGICKLNTYHSTLHLK